MEKTYGMMVAASVIEEVKKAVIGKQDCIKKVMAAILAGGHILIEDIPGVGKTTMAVAFSKSMGLLRHRVQFTPDVLPADIVGFSLYDKKTQQFVRPAQENIEKIIKFINSEDLQIDFNTLKEAFIENTPQYTVELMLKIK